jgi:hypothetical protein
MNLVGKVGNLNKAYDKELKTVSWFHLLNSQLSHRTYTSSIKYRLFMKLNAQIETILRDEFFKSN